MRGVDGTSLTSDKQLLGTVSALSKGEGKGSMRGALGLCPSEPGIHPHPRPASTRFPRGLCGFLGWREPLLRGTEPSRKRRQPKACDTGLGRANVDSGSEGQSARAGIFFLPRPSPDRPGLWLSPAVPICPMAAGQMLVRMPGVRVFSCWGLCEPRLGGKGSTLSRWGSQLQAAGLWLLSCCCPCAVLEGGGQRGHSGQAGGPREAPGAPWPACLCLPPGPPLPGADSTSSCCQWPTVVQLQSLAGRWALLLSFGARGRGPVLAAVAMGASQKVCLAWE